MNNNVGTPNPVPEKKSNIGLIIGLIVGLVVVIGGLIALFFLWIKPTFIDANNSGGSDKEEEKTNADLYASYLKKSNYADAGLDISFVDLNIDDTQDLIVKDGSHIIAIATINSKDKVESFKVNDEAYIDLVYDIDAGKEKWVLIKEGKYSDNYSYYDLSKSIEKGELVDAEEFESSVAVAKKYISLEADIEYEGISESNVSKKTKSMLKNDKNYDTDKTVKEIKEELENRNKKHILKCTGVSTDDPYDIELTYENGNVNKAVYTVYLDIDYELSTEQEKLLIENMNKAAKETGLDFNYSLEKIGGTKYKVSTEYPLGAFQDLFGENANEYLSYGYIDEFIKSLEEDGGTCKLD